MTWLPKTDKIQRDMLQSSRCVALGSYAQLTKLILSRRLRSSDRSIRHAAGHPNHHYERPWVELVSWLS